VGLAIVAYEFLLFLIYIFIKGAIMKKKKKKKGGLKMALTASGQPVIIGASFADWLVRREAIEAKKQQENTKK
jgi:hypothetical protein